VKAVSTSTPAIVYVAFHPPRPGWERWGHVEAFGRDPSGVWFFLDPTRFGLRLKFAIDAAAVDAEFAERLATADMVFRLPRTAPLDGRPMLCPYTCASVVGALIGIRAWTVEGLRLKLLASDAEVIRAYPRSPEGRQGSEAGEAA
jgi:hypothetical protein